MFKPKSISTKVHIPLMISLVLGFMIVGAVSYTNISNIQHDTYEKEIVETNIYVEKSFQAKSGIALTNAINLSQNSDFKNALINKDRELALKAGQRLLKSFKENTKFRNIKIHIHTKDAKSFLRVWNPQKNGDDLSSFRNTISEVKNTKKPLSAIETGRAGLVFRGIAPIFDDEHNYIGSVEFIMGFGSNVKGLKKDLNSEAIVFIDKKLLNIATKLKGKPTAGNFVVAQKSYNKKLLKDIQKHKNLFDNKSYVRGDDFLLNKISIKDFKGKVVGYFVTGKDLKLVDAIATSAKNNTYLQLLVMFLSDLLVIILLSFIIAKAVKKPLSKMVTDIKDIINSDKINLRKKLDTTSGDEIAEVNSWLNKFIQRVSETIHQTQDVSQNNTAISKEFTTISDKMATSINTTTDTVEELNQNINHIEESVTESLELSNSTQEDIKETQKLLDETQQVLKTVVEEIEVGSQKEHELSNKLTELSGEAEAVKGVLTIIGDIAEQTNLLALNAAIEAARAGEHGRGFAVVADEVRQLAEKTQKSLVEINATISVMVQSIVNISSEMESASEDAVKLMEMSSDVAQKMQVSQEKMVESVESVNKTMDSSNEVAKNIKDITHKVRTINEQSHQNNKLVKEIDNSLDKLNDSTKNLSQKIAEFEV